MAIRGQTPEFGGLQGEEDSEEMGWPVDMRRVSFIAKARREIEEQLEGLFVLASAGISL